MKVGRNKLCPCGSGAKFKHCHGKVGNHYFPSGPDLQKIIQVREAAERRRKTQQGHGKPIISTRWDGKQVIAVGNTVHWSDSWKTFPDFLADYIKKKIGSEWGNAEIAKPLHERHTLMQWYDAICRYQATVIKKPGTPSSIPQTGVVACYYSVAYGLYLLDHNIELQDRLLARLRNPGNFQGAYYELLVASALLLAGFSLTLEDETDPTQKHCEFAAVSPISGKRYWIEAKMRGVAGELGRTTADGTSSRNPLSSLMRQLNASFAKPAANERMIFIDLNAEMAPDASDRNRPRFIDDATRRLEIYEQRILKEGQRAYVFVTNANFHKDLGAPAQLVALPFGLGIPDFNRPGMYSLAERYRQDKEHADALQVAEGFSKILALPATFDGSMPSVAFGGAREPVIIGETYNFEGAGREGEDLIGTVSDAIVNEGDKTVTVAVNSPDGTSCLLKEPISDAQLSDYKSFEDSYFGKVVRPPGKIETPYDLFEFFMHAYQHTSRDKLLELIGGRLRSAESMDDEELRIWYCERLVAASGLFDIVDGVLIPKRSKKP